MSFAGCIGGPHPLPPDHELPDPVTPPSTDGHSAAGAGMPGGAGIGGPTTNGRGGSGGSWSHGEAGRDGLPSDAGTRDCDSGEESGDDAAALCEDDAGVLAP